MMSDRAVYATKANAEAIHNATDRAWKQLLGATNEIRDALVLAEGDYEHNDERLRDIYGAVRLLGSSLSTEMHMWDVYARNRSADS